jgi:alkylated DNA repair dioxygenase AlkB
MTQVLIGARNPDDRLYIGVLVTMASSMTGQLSLFQEPSTVPEGLRYHADFITPAAERDLLAAFQTLPFKAFQFGVFEGKRRVVSFGWKYDYTRQRLDAATDIPRWLDPLRERAAGFIGQRPEVVRQALVTEYDTGAGIGWHRDKPMFETIIGISLGSDCVFRLRRKAGDKWQRFSLNAAARSIYSMAGAARRQWEHSIPGVDAKRYSITFRTMVDGEAP